MRPRIALLRRFSVPLNCLSEIFCYTFSILIANSKTALCICITLLCRFPIPFYCLFFVLCHAISIVI